jgi:hypothetical protein
MSELQRIEQRLLELTATFDLRLTIERAADIGDLLIVARSLVRHGEWIDWLDRLGFVDMPIAFWNALPQARVAA